MFKLYTTIALTTCLSLSVVADTTDDLSNQPFIEKDNQAFDLVCSQAFKTDKIRRLLSLTENTPINRRKTGRGISAYSKQLKRRNSEDSVAAINSDWEFRVIKVNGNYAVVFDKDNKPMDVWSIAMQASSRRTIGGSDGFVRQPPKILSHSFFSNMKTKRFITLSTNHNIGPHLLISKLIVGKDSPVFDVKAYACVERR